MKKDKSEHPNYTMRKMVCDRELRSFMLVSPTCRFPIEGSE